MSRKKTAELDTPFSSVEWPAIPQEDQDAILELLCTLLEPIGQHRRDHVTPSRGKRSRKQSRKKESAADVAPDSTQGKEMPSSLAPSSEAPPPPELAAFVDVGLANITRVLADSTASSIESKATAEAAESPGAPSGLENTKPTGRTSPPTPSPPYAAVFVVRSGHPSAFYSHFPQMVAAASRSSSSQSDAANTDPASSNAIRLVGFSRASEERLSTCLGIPRVSSIALRAGAPQSQGLVRYLRERVTPVEIRWLSEAQAGKHRGTQIHIAEVPIGQKKKQKTAHSVNKMGNNPAHKA